MSHETPSPMQTSRVQELIRPYEEIGLSTLVFLPKKRLVECSPSIASRYGIDPIWEGVPGCFAGVVSPLDQRAMLEMHDQVVGGAELVSATFRNTILGNFLKVTFHAVERDDDGTTTLALGILQDSVDAAWNENALPRVDEAPEGRGRDALAHARNRVAHAIGSAFYCIYYADVATHEFLCFREELPTMSSLVGSHGTYEVAWAAYVNSFVVPEHRELLLAWADLDHLVSHLDHDRTVSFDYRHVDLGWCHGEFAICERDETGTPNSVVYTVRNTNAEHERAQRERESLFAATHDALTGTLNRRAFDADLARDGERESKVGLLLMDIDNFKDLNDEHGHDFGDRVLVELGQALPSLFREDDRVYRLGGDEFAVLLGDCDASCWEPLKLKLAKLHERLEDMFSLEDSVTLSSGVCFGARGLEPWMYEVADRGLYSTKRRGRAGSTLMGADGQPISSWHDSATSGLSLAAFANTNAGAGRLEYIRDGSRPSRFVIGDGLRSMFSIPAEATPEQCFLLWDAGVEKADREVLFRAGEAMLERGNVETSYLWHSPDGDSFRVRLIGSGRVEKGADVFYSIHRAMRGVTLVEAADETKLIAAAQDSVYTLSLYLDLAKDTMTVNRMPGLPEGQTIEVGDARDQIADRARSYACAVDAERLLAFLDTSTLAGRLGTAGYIDHEFKSETKAGWCRCRWIAVRRDRAGRVTHALLNMTSIDAAKQEQAAHDRKLSELMQVHYDATQSLTSSRLLGFALIDRTSLECRSWGIGDKGLESLEMTYDELLDRACGAVVDPSPEEYRSSLELGHVLSEVERVGSHSVVSRMDRLGRECFVEYRFAPYDRDPRFVIETIQDRTELHGQDGRSLKDLFDNVPGGLITYEWDGDHLRILHISRYYEELYGSSIAHEANGERTPDFMRIHPDDLPAYVAAIKDALERTHELHYEFRVWNNLRDSWSWCRIDAVSRELANGHSLVYAMYCDVTEHRSHLP